MRIEVSRDVFRLAQVFTISRGSRTEAQVLTVRITDGGVTGWGECVPYARYGETLESVTAEIEALRGPLTRDALYDLLPAGAARNAVDVLDDAAVALQCINEHNCSVGASDIDCRCRCCVGADHVVHHAVDQQLLFIGGCCCHRSQPRFPDFMFMPPD